MQKMVGSFNVEFFQRELAKKPDQDIFPVAGTIYPVEEKSIIKELEERAQKYDWEGAKKRAVREKHPLEKSMDGRSPSCPGTQRIFN
ncbi:hypothetical protein ACLB1R_36125 [Escherichia coli]